MNWIAMPVSLLLPSDSLVKYPIDGAVRRRRMLRGGGVSDDDDGNDETDALDLDEPGWRITRKMMDRVDSLDWLRSELGEGGLRRMIFEINKADLEASRSSGGGRTRQGAAITGFDRAGPSPSESEGGRPGEGDDFQP